MPTAHVENQTQKRGPEQLTFYPAYCFSVSPTYNAWVRLTARLVHGLQSKDEFDGQKIYFHLNHPIRYVRLVGLVVALDIYPTRWIFTIDDSSGETIEVTCSRSQPQQQQQAHQKPSCPEQQGAVGLVLPDPTITYDTSHSHAPLPKIPIPPIPNTTLLTPAHPSLEGKSITGQPINLKGIDVGTVLKVKGSISTFRGIRQIDLERVSILGTTGEEVQAWEELVRNWREVLSRPWVVGEGEVRRLKDVAEGREKEEIYRKERRMRRRRRKEEEERGKGEKGKEKGKEARGREEKKRKEKEGDIMRRHKRETEKEGKKCRDEVKNHESKARPNKS